MPRWDAMGWAWEDVPISRKNGERVLGPIPEIPVTGWTPPNEFPNIRDAAWIAVDVETWDPELNDYGPGWARGKGHIVGASIAWSGGKMYLPIRHEVQKEMNMDADTVLRYLRWALSGNCPKIGANISYDIGWLKWEQVEVNGPLYDVQFAEALLNSTSKLALDDLGVKWLKRGKLTEVLEEWARGYYMTSHDRWRQDIYRCPITLVGPYAEEDAQMPYEILMKQWPQLVSNGLMPLFEMECGLIRLLVDMRMAGIQINLPYANQLRDKLVGQEATLQKELDFIARTEVNVNAADSLAYVFDKLELPYGRTEPTAANPEGRPSFTKDFLQSVKHPFSDLVLAKRAAAKLRSTFVESYLLDSHVNGKVHCSFHPLSGAEGGARTGRFSSSAPNLQNIPIRSEEGKWIRQAFVMDAGHQQIRDYDYSQIEYRMLAHFATGAGADDVRYRYNVDPTLDFHTMAGAMVKQYTGRELDRAYTKTINFGIIYGIGVPHLSEMLGVTETKARELRNQYHKALPFTKTTMKATIDEVSATGICTTILGRRTSFDMWEPEEWSGFQMALPRHEAVAKWGYHIRRAGTQKALNYRLQGSAADIMKMTMYRNYKEGVFNVTGVPRLTVHDELLFSDPGNVPEDAWKHMQHVAETCIPGINVPIKFEGKAGADWSAAH